MIDICLEESNQQKFGASLKIIGVGGAGGNAVNSMITASDLEVASFLIANTDAQALTLSPAQTKIQLGGKITKGLGAGSNPDVGRRSAEEDIETIMQKVEGSDILFLTGGLGGGTGSGALPVIAQAAKELGILTVAIVTKPFVFEGKRRARIAEEAIKSLRSAVDTLIIVPNQRLLEIVDSKISMLDAFALSNDILKQAIKGISDIITKSGHINVDFADVKAIMKDMGMALMGTGKASGEDRARVAAQQAISSPLLENVSIEGAKGVLINITGNISLGLYEINEAASLVYDLVSEDANIILGSVIDPDMGDEIMVTVIATGFETVQKEIDQRIHGARKEATAQSERREEPQREKKVVENKEPEGVQNFSNVQQERKLEHPSVAHVKQAASSREVDAFDIHDLDTPTFMRKKAEQEQEQRMVIKVEEVAAQEVEVASQPKQYYAEQAKEQRQQQEQKERERYQQAQHNIR